MKNNNKLNNTEMLNNKLMNALGEIGIDIDQLIEESLNEILSQIARAHSAITWMLRNGGGINTCMYESMDYINSLLHKGTLERELSTIMSLAQ